MISKPHIYRHSGRWYCSGIGLCVIDGSPQLAFLQWRTRVYEISAMKLAWGSL